MGCTGEVFQKRRSVLSNNLLAGCVLANENICNRVVSNIERGFIVSRSVGYVTVVVAFRRSWNERLHYTCSFEFSLGEVEKECEKGNFTLAFSRFVHG